MQNYYEYFTEIEQRFQQRRGSILMLSTLDWALIETWREAGVPLEAVLCGIDAAFDRYEQRAARATAGKGRLRKINGLAWAAQAVIEAAESAAEATVGSSVRESSKETGLEGVRIAAYLRGNARKLREAGVDPDVVDRLETLSAELEGTHAPALETLDQTLTALEQRLFAALLLATPEEDLVRLREEAAREVAPFRSRMQAMQLRQVEQQFVQKRLLQGKNLPRLSLFYMNVQ